MNGDEIFQHGINVTSLAIMGVIGLACYILKNHGSSLDEFEKRISENEVSIARLRDRSESIHQTLEKLDKKLDNLQTMLLDRLQS